MDDKMLMVPYVVHEAAQSRSERMIKRLIVALVIAIACIFASNALWLYEWTQYDYVGADSSESTITVDGKDGIANYIGNSGVINNGKDSGKNSEEKNSP